MPKVAKAITTFPLPLLSALGSFPNVPEGQLTEEQRQTLQLVAQFHDRLKAALHAALSGARGALALAAFALNDALTDESKLPTVVELLEHATGDDDSDSDSSDDDEGAEATAPAAAAADPAQPRPDTAHALAEAATRGIADEAKRTAAYATLYAETMKAEAEAYAKLQRRAEKEYKQQLGRLLRPALSQVALRAHANARTAFLRDAAVELGVRALLPKAQDLGTHMVANIAKMLVTNAYNAIVGQFTARLISYVKELVREAAKTDPTKKAPKTREARARAKKRGAIEQQDGSDFIFRVFA